jgi:hypothetical protein
MQQGDEYSVYEELPLVIIRRSIKANHPLNAESVFQHSEIGTPEGFIHRHGYFSARCQSFEEDVCLLC